MSARCGGCGHTGKVNKYWRIRGKWKRCPQCVKAWAEERKLDREAYQAAEGDWVEGVEMGWNGVPSERALRQRRR